jgi:preprotein translocase subunit SecD
MKRTLSLSVLLAFTALNAFAGTIRTVEVRPLAQTALIGSNDFKSAEVTGNGEKATLNIELKGPAAQRFRAYTAKNVGQDLPFLVDGKVVQAPLVRTAIEGSTFQVEPLNRELADRIAQFINARQ